MTAPVFSQSPTGPEGNPQFHPGATWAVIPLAFADTGVVYSSKECEDYYSLEPCSGFVTLRLDDGRLLMEIQQQSSGRIISPIVLDTPVEEYNDTFGNRLFRAHYAQADASPYVRRLGHSQASHISVRHDDSLLNQITAEYQTELEDLDFDVTIGAGVNTNFRTLVARGDDNTVHMLFYRNNGGVTVRLLGH